MSTHIFYTNLYLDLNAVAGEETQPSDLLGKVKMIDSCVRFWIIRLGDCLDSLYIILHPFFFWVNHYTPFLENHLCGISFFFVQEINIGPAHFLISRFGYGQKVWYGSQVKKPNSISGWRPNHFDRYLYVWE